MSQSGQLDGPKCRRWHHTLYTEMRHASSEKVPAISNLMKSLSALSARSVLEM